MIYLSLVVEDTIQEVTARKVLRSCIPEHTVTRVLGLQGSAYIDRRARGLAIAARHGCFVVMRDLDREECAPALVRRVLPGGSPSGMVFSVAVREVEAWLIGDYASLGRFLGVPQLERDPERLPDPKAYLVETARRSRNRQIREALVPTGTARVGRLYNSTLLEYVVNHWRVEHAAENSPSLHRSVQRLSALAEREPSG